MKFTEMKTQLNSLTIFRNILNSDVIEKLINLLETNQKDTSKYVANYCAFVSTLYNANVNFSKYLYSFIMNDENIYIRMRAQKKAMPKELEASLLNDLNILQEFSELEPHKLTADLSYDGFLPKWEVSTYDFKKQYMKRIENLAFEGYGVYSKYHVFTMGTQGLEPVIHPDPQRLEDLVGYAREREMVVKNTLAFLHGMKASNVLLYGDAGTGKSSTIKAIANAHKAEGLRLVELKKHQLHQLPDLIEELANNPLKFIIFIDDLSFSGNDDNFVALKTILEGGVSINTKNIVIYATSNRRHLVKESMKDRNSDELFTNDSIQETMSLAARFGLTITFSKPNKDLYLEIVNALAQEHQLALSGEELMVKAEAFAIRNNGRSPRTAKQFIELEKIKENIK